MVASGLGKDLLVHVQAALGLTSRESTRLGERVWMFSSRLRQPRKDDRTCNKTPFFDRWDVGQTSYLTPQDPRYATEQECRAVYATLIAELLEARDASPPSQTAAIEAQTVLGRPLRAKSLVCVHTGEPITGEDVRRAVGYVTPRLGAYEVPASYVVGLDSGGRHERNNVGWMKPIHVNYTLRATLQSQLTQAGVDREAIGTALDKIQVKAYCTDKQTMPPHFSNRDIRWETWTTSAQYSSRYDCAVVELELLCELFEFVGAPPLAAKLVAELQTARKKPLSVGQRRCFVTGRALRFQEFVDDAMNPRGGKARHHVGHVQPLTRNGRHVGDNVAWMTDDGNRIQGNDTVEEIEAKLADAVEFHLRRDLVAGKRQNELLEKAKRIWTALNELRERLGLEKKEW